MANNVHHQTAHTDTYAQCAKTHIPEFSAQSKNQTLKMQPIFDPNVNQENLKLPTPVQAHLLKHYLQGYDPFLSHYLVQGFTSGFSLGCSAYPKPRLCRNHSSTTQHADYVLDKLQNEIDLGKIAGPYPSRPFQNFVWSPLGVVPKSTQGKYRLLHDLSFPSADSVNSYISEEHSKIKYDTIDTIISLVLKFGKGSLMTKSDIEDAFRIIPLHPDSYHALGLTWAGQYYFDKCLPMGASSSCKIFESFSSALQWIMVSKFNLQGMSHMIDDFFFIGPNNSSKCIHDLENFLALCSTLGVPIKRDKTVLPCKVITIYGLEIDSEAMECRLPSDKLEK
ncbi:uncharacterized protein LOC133179795 isoform X1 [Saccostrea echinata]|uniref:uncharacterized protein LOC133179795 isoform X1 n=1 Tax=Saccostrea echinata TaxID=191078 RepID=UPI002A7F3951|nr:uncharacterized protein LOC133179795 isoform X1 [Saccostrea echinata]